jgi:hypothetical protein
MNKEVEILKIGSIMPIVPILGTYDTSQFRKKTIMIVFDGGKLFDYYVARLIINCSDEYSYQRTAQSIVGYTNVFRSSLVGNQPVDTLKGISDGDPIVGQSYTINNSSWHTSKVERIIDGCILITKNSVYALHNKQDVRDKRLNDLGI